MPLIAPGWTCRVTFQLKPHRHRYRKNRDFGWVPGFALGTPACARLGKSEQLEKWVLNQKCTFRSAGVLWSIALCNVSANLYLTRIICDHFWCHFNNGAVCSPPLDSPLIQWLFAPGRAGVGTEHPEPRFFWISTWKAAYCLQLPALFMEALFHLIAIVLDQSFGHALHGPVAQMCWEGRRQGRMMSSHSPSWLWTRFGAVMVLVIQLSFQLVLLIKGTARGSWKLGTGRLCLWSNITPAVCSTEQSRLSSVLSWQVTRMGSVFVFVFFLFYLFIFPSAGLDDVLLAAYFA